MLVFYLKARNSGINDEIRMAMVAIVERIINNFLYFLTKVSITLFTG